MKKLNYQKENAFHVKVAIDAIKHDQAKELIKKLEMKCLQRF